MVSEALTELEVRFLYIPWARILQCENMKSFGEAVSVSSSPQLGAFFQCLTPYARRATFLYQMCLLKVKFCVFAVLKSTQPLGSPVTSVGRWFLPVTFVTDSEIDLAALGVCV